MRRGKIKGNKCRKEEMRGKGTEEEQRKRETREWRMMKEDEEQKLREGEEGGERMRGFQAVPTEECVYSVSC